MKKETDYKKDNNQIIWEEFVSKNKIKKNYSNGGHISFNIVNHRASNELEEFTSHPKANIKTQSFERKNFLGKSILSLTAPKTNIGIERNKLRRIKNGKIIIEGTLDLHGFSLKKAESKLRLYVGDGLRQKKRLLLIITGKGSNSKPNIHGKTLTIKSELKNWLSDSFYSDKVQYISKALDRHGGEGAYYFFLKKSKNILS
ncbi:Smr/MutS family endonuclease [Paracoccaceae bacterium]|nr:Smr/MutS family endonuclease [Paracoccaceae bacterium]